MQWEAIIIFLGGAGAISGVLSYLGRIAIESYLNGRVESYKSDLQRITFEHSVRFSNLHSKRAEVIAEIYELLSDVENKARLLSTPIIEEGEAPRSTTYKRTADIYFQLYEKYTKSRIFFPDDLCQLMDKFLTQSQKPISFYKVAEQVAKQDPEGLQQGLQDDLQRKFMETWTEAEKNIPAAKIAIEAEFRKILGVVR